MAWISCEVVPCGGRRVVFVWILARCACGRPRIVFLSSWRGSTGPVDPARACCAHARDWGQGLSFGLNSCTCLGIASLQLSLTLSSQQPGAVALLDSSAQRYGRELLGLFTYEHVQKVVLLYEEVVVQ